MEVYQKFIIRYSVKKGAFCCFFVLLEVSRHPYTIQYDQYDRLQHVDGLDSLALEQVQADGEDDNASFLRGQTLFKSMSALLTGKHALIYNEKNQANALHRK
jgi:hypothetical protein